MRAVLRHRVLPVGVAVAALASGQAAAAITAEAAAGTITTLLGIALLLWVVGNLLTYHRYDSRGPKGGAPPVN